MRGQFRYGILVAQVYLVDDYEYGTGHFGQPVHVLAVLVALFHDIGHVQDDVGVTDGSVHVLHHTLLQGIGRLEDARGVGVHYLVVISVDYSHNPVPGGLGLGGDDGQPLAYEGVHQCGFAHVGVADDVDESGAVPDATHRS